MATGVGGETAASRHFWPIGLDVNYDPVELWIERLRRSLYMRFESGMGCKSAHFHRGRMLGPLGLNQNSFSGQ